MEYPLINITFTNWNKYHSFNFFYEAFLDDEYIYTRDKDFFKEVLLGNEFVDNRGDIYEVVGKERVLGWRTFLPFFYKAELKFKPKDKSIDLDEIKELLKKRIERLDLDADIISDTLKDISNVKSLKDLKKF